MASVDDVPVSVHITTLNQQDRWRVALKNANGLESQRG
jgi:hypothetical protein